MLPSELPISEEAVRAVEEVLDPGDFAQAVRDGYNPCTLAEDAVRAFLQAEGFEVDWRAAMYEAGAVEDPPYDYGDVDFRLRGPWKPAHSSTEGGEGS